MVIAFKDSGKSRGEGSNALSGQAPADRYTFRDGEGKKKHRTDAIFPLFRYLPDQELEFLGTGFFITDNGLFVTAKHMIETAFENGTQSHCLSLIQLIPDGGYVIRPALACSSHYRSDIAIGVAATASHSKTGEVLSNDFLTLTLRAPMLGERLSTYAYPATKVTLEHSVYCRAAHFDGCAIEFLPNGQGILQGSCYKTSISIHGGASGGPVWGTSGHVIGINSASCQGMSGVLYSYVTRIDELLALVVPGVLLPESSQPRNMFLVELTAKGYVIFDPPLSKCSDQLGPLRGFVQSQ